MIETLKQIVKEAGELIVHAGEVTENIDEKPGSANYVTAYDVAVQNFLIEKLRAWMPGCRFVGEEEEYSAGSVGSEPTFIIDPIDGTTNFICDFRFSGISVALAKDGALYAGVVYNPFRQEMYWGQRGIGAFLNETPLHLQDKPLEKGVVNFGTAPYNAELRTDAFALAKAVSYHTMDLRELGSASLSLCYTAAGRCVAYYSPRLCVWDYAAAALLIELAGGVAVRGDTGAALNFATKVPVLAGTPHAVQEFLEIKKETLG